MTACQYLFCGRPVRYELRATRRDEPDAAVLYGACVEHLAPMVSALRGEEGYDAVEWRVHP